MSAWDLRCREAEFLKHSVGLNRRSVDVQRYSHDHSCGIGCQFECMREGMIFAVDGRRFHASGQVWVCRDSLNVHQCGDYCRSSVICGEGEVCTITGVPLNQMFSMAASGKDADVRVCGGRTFLPHGGNASYGSSSTNLFDDGAGEEEEKEVVVSRKRYRGHGDNNESADYDDYDDDDEDDEAILLRDVADDSFYYKFFPLGRRDVDYVLWKYGHLRVKELVTKIAERREWRKQAEHAWNVRVLGPGYMRRLENEAEATSNNFLEWLADHVHTKLGVDEEPVDLLYVFSVFMDTTLGKYKGVYYGGDPVALNAANKVYFIESMLNIWERFTEMPEVAAEDFYFNECCTAILSKMQTGVEVVVWMLDGEERPREYSHLTVEQEKRARVVRMWMINPHRELHLVSSKLVCDVQNELTKERHAKRDTTMVVSNCYTEEHAFPKTKQSVMNRRRSGTQGSSRMPPLCILSKIVATIVKNAKSLSDLQSYCMSEINRKAYYQVGDTYK